MNGPMLKTLELLDLEPAVSDFRAEVLAGLRRPRKEIPCKYFYDAAGSALFDRICGLEEYYPTRTEVGIMRRSMDEIVAHLGRDCLLIEYGSGSSQKTQLLLRHAPRLAGYIPIDISREHLIRAAAEVATAYPWLELLPVCADYTAPFDLPTWPAPVARRVVYYPGSTIGNFHPPEAEAFLRRVARVCGPGGGLLIGVDLKKDPAVIERAYNDAAGVTAAFNRNLLARANRELGSDFDLNAFRHHAPYDDALGRIEMRLVSRRRQTVHIGGEAVVLAPAEPIVTEYSYKYGLTEFEALAWRAGFMVDAVWLDDRRWFSVQYLTARP